MGPAESGVTGECLPAPGGDAMGPAATTTIVVVPAEAGAPPPVILLVNAGPDKAQERDVLHRNTLKVIRMQCFMLVVIQLVFAFAAVGITVSSWNAFDCINFVV